MAPPMVGTPFIRHFVGRVNKKIRWIVGYMLKSFQGRLGWAAMSSHKQVWVKVNAPVDEGIAELIQALSSFPKLQTIESCQGGWPRSGEDKEGMPANVWFHYGQHDHAPGHREIGDFVLGYFGPGLMKEVGDLVGVSLEVKTQYVIMARLYVRQGAMPRTVKVVRKLARDFNRQRGRPVIS